MFKKKPTVKPLAPLRSSDRRKTAEQIISELGLELPSTDLDDPEEKAAAVAKISNIRNALLPENALSARFTTTVGPDLKQVSGTVYVGSYRDDQRILWVKLEDRLYPTVYTLWQNPGIVPLLHTHTPVIEKLQGGADLMTPGLAAGPPFPSKAKQNATVAIASLDSPSVPLAVGRCEIDVSALEKVQGARGHAVENIHWAGDELWSWSNASKPGSQPPDSLQGWLDDDDEAADIATKTEQLDLADGANGGVSLHSGEEVAGAQDRTDIKDAFESVEDKPLSTKEIDEGFRKAFLYGVRHHMDVNRGQPSFGLSFPLTQSFVMANLVQPFLPAYTPAQTASLQIKKTSWKNIKKFIKSLDKEQIVKTKDRDTHEVVIMDIDFKDRTIADFTPYRLPKKETVGGAAQGREHNATVISDPGDSSVGQKIKKLELYRPKEKLADMFEKAQADPRGYHTTSEIGSIVTSYIAIEELVVETNKRLVKIDPILANAVFDGSTHLDKEVINKGTVPRDALIDRIIKSCSPFWSIIRNDESSSTSKPKAGAAPKITIMLETRSGNKTVTKVSGVEAYFIPPQPLADELRKVCAGSTSVEQLKGSSPKTPVMEIMVQGPQKDAVIKALEKRGVNRQWVEIVDKVKGKKKG
ncbi:RNA binding protein-like protein Ligatin/Tma64 [Pseudovirgaria hyperparasitica]|uniref:RNA binding protein-like protein Ligatin/Tma64 n=1 Tax=Pseudovirgaria hyperparasitica TaxID=470096 RepID=A0A6A6VZI7_9PEZI|nr:RNA binding protein-like protein Ligatin/Tma64 [Pseudovirgaria hyperparasitica]KAF2755266.1 RNA binding protein-like protein Ligatin/Tma64 [Pseudovirgaria hyperparasitica]